MANGVVSVPGPENEPIRSYAPGSSERASLERRLSEMLGEVAEIPLIIGGEEVLTGNTGQCVCPHDHGHVLATYQKGGEKEVGEAIEASQEAWSEWSEMNWEARAAVLLKAATRWVPRSSASGASADLPLDMEPHCLPPTHAGSIFPSHRCTGTPQIFRAPAPVEVAPPSYARSGSGQV